MRKIKTFVTSLKFQLICGTIFLLLVLNCAEGVIGYFQFTRSFVEEYNESAFRTAETAAAIVNADHIQDYLATGGDSDEYNYHPPAVFPPQALPCRRRSWQAAPPRPAQPLQACLFSSYFFMSNF